MTGMGSCLLFNIKEDAMDNSVSNDNKQCAHCSEGFNYCFFSKTLVVLPALSVVAFVPAMLFDNPILQVAGIIAAVTGTLYAAIWLDRLPALKKKIKLIPVQAKQ